MKKKNIRIRLKTMTVIEKLSVINVYIPKSLLSRLPIREISIVFSLTGSSVKVSGGRRKGGRNKTTVDKIKNHFTDCSSLAHKY